MALKINEIFRNVQGEGELIGIPHTFIRLSGCNLNCSWCDTPYARDIDAGEEMGEEEIADKISTRHVCVTGGEPLLQDIKKLCKKLRENGLFVTVETNCTRFDKRLSKDVDLFTVSPKLRSSAQSYDKKVLKNYLDLHLKNRIQLKFVIQSEEDLKEVFQILEDYKEIMEKDIPTILQPDGVCNYKEYRSRIKNLIERTVLDERINDKLKDLNFRVLPQLHKIAWGDKRSV